MEAFYGIPKALLYHIRNTWGKKNLTESVQKQRKNRARVEKQLVKV